MAEYQHLEDNLEDDVELPQQQQQQQLDEQPLEEEPEQQEAPSAGPKRLGGGHKAKAGKEGKEGKKRKRDKGDKKKRKGGEEEGQEEEEVEEEEDMVPSSGGPSEDPDELDGRAGGPAVAPAGALGDEALEADDADEVLFGRKRRKNEESQSQMTEFVRQTLGKMEACAQLDHEQWQAGKPAINKLQMVQEVEGFLAQRKYHELFIACGGLGVLKAWLEPYEDGTLPNVKVRNCVLNGCKALPIDTSRDDIKDNLKASKLGTRIIFLAKCPDETQANRKVALELVQNWSRPIFFDPEAEAEKRRARDEALQRARLHAQQSNKEAEAAAAASEEARKKIKYGQPGYRWHASIPQTLKLDYVVAPTSQSAVSEAAAEVQRGGKKDEGKLDKKLREVVRKQKGSTARAAVPSVEGRNIIF